MALDLIRKWFPGNTFLVLPQNIQDMECKSMLGLTSMCSNQYSIPVGHTEDDMSRDM